ncbi:MAG TPA: LysM peptidoglycan-binding domain-containing protein [Candidatus Dormibacteraeota bacterium]|nr:LysM peptidoglycan-binding domain-containing protein [Candidatus Dormibacteraeota bacterium]
MQTRTTALIVAGAVALAAVAGSIFSGSVAATDRVVIVQPGDTLSGIALEHGVSVRQLVALNRITDPNRILAGQPLVIVRGVTAAQPAPAPTTHRVAHGETLTGIARRYGTTIAAIAAANGIANPSLIRVGQVLVVPASSPAPPAAGASTGSLPDSMAARVAQRDDVRRLIVAEADAQGVPPALALAVAWQESGWQQGVVSSAGAIGIMQLIPASGTWVAQSMLGEPVDLYDAGSNVRAGVRLLRHYLDRYGGDRWLALAAYYQGQTAADRHGVYAVSRPYIASVLRLEQIFTQ